MLFSLAPYTHVTVEAGDFDMRGFEIARSEFFDSHRRPYVTFQDKQIKFSTDCVRKLGKNNMVEFLVNPREMMFAVRTAAKDSRHSVPCSRVSNGIYYPKTISCAAYMLVAYNRKCKYPLVWNKLYEKNSGTTDGLDADIPGEEEDEQERIEEQHDSALVIRTHPAFPDTVLCADTPFHRRAALLTADIVPQKVDCSGILLEGIALSGSLQTGCCFIECFINDGVIFFIAGVLGVVDDSGDTRFIPWTV